MHRLSHQQQDHARPDADCVGESRLQNLIEQGITHSHLETHIVEVAEVVDDLFLRVRHLHRLHRAKQFTQEACHLACSLTIVAAPPLDALTHEIHKRDNQHEREEDGQGDEGIDVDHDHKRNSYKDNECEQIIKVH